MVMANVLAALLVKAVRVAHALTMKSPAVSVQYDTTL